MTIFTVEEEEEEEEEKDINHYHVIWKRIKVPKGKVFKATWNWAIIVHEHHNGVKNKRRRR